MCDGLGLRVSWLCLSASSGVNVGAASTFLYMTDYACVSAETSLRLHRFACPTGVFAIMCECFCKQLRVFECSFGTNPDTGQSRSNC